MSSLIYKRLVDSSILLLSFLFAHYRFLIFWCIFIKWYLCVPTILDSYKLFGYNFRLIEWDVFVYFPSAGIHSSVSIQSHLCFAFYALASGIFIWFYEINFFTNFFSEREKFLIACCSVFYVWIVCFCIVSWEETQSYCLILWVKLLNRMYILQMLV